MLPLCAEPRFMLSTVLGLQKRDVNLKRANLGFWAHSAAMFSITRWKANICWLVCVVYIESAARAWRTESEKKGERPHTADKGDCLHTVCADKDYLRTAKIAQQVSRPSAFSSLFLAFGYKTRIFDCCTQTQLALSAGTYRHSSLYASQCVVAGGRSEIRIPNMHRVLCSYPYAQWH